MHAIILSNLVFFCTWRHCNFRRDPDNEDAAILEICGMGGRFDLAAVVARFGPGESFDERHPGGMARRHSTDRGRGGDTPRPAFYQHSASAVLLFASHCERRTIRSFVVLISQEVMQPSACRSLDPPAPLPCASKHA